MRSFLLEIALNKFNSCTFSHILSGELSVLKWGTLGIVTLFCEFIATFIRYGQFFQQFSYLLKNPLSFLDLFHLRQVSSRSILTFIAVFYKLLGGGGGG